MTQEFTEVLKKEDLINGYAEAYDKKKNESKEILESVFSYLEDILYVQNKGFKIGDIGTVKLQIVPERVHKHPKTRVELPPTPEHYKVKLKPNSAFEKDLKTVPVEG